MEASTLGQRIVYFRKKAGVSQKNLAAVAGIKPSTLSYYEKDKREPSVQIIKNLSKALNITGDTLLGLEPYPDLIAQNRDEYTLLSAFRTLNGLGQKRALESVSDLSEVPKYANRGVHG
ncbi:MAG: helix-turn-helix domain-containing protein [Chitinispirillales bacterium]|jgi:transcriptional regulator with XRE-family HTH domain|nr:helix-turn-helix domain-containing protein [Chitinispirillales bacterium]